MGGIQELAAEWQKVYASVLRIVGAALVATFTAIVVNFLLRIRLEGALEAGRIPEGVDERRGLLGRREVRVAAHFRSRLST